METDHKDDGTYAHEVAMLFRNHSDLMFRAAYSVTRNAHDAEDVVQSIFLTLVEEGAAGKRPPGFIRNPPGYLHNAATKRALNVIRTRGRQKLDDDDIETVEIEASMAEARHERDLERMGTALAAMSTERVELLSLFHKEDYSCAEISGITRRALPSVWVELHRARKQVRKLMGIEEKSRETKEKKHSAARGPVVTDGSEA